MFKPVTVPGALAIGYQTQGPDGRISTAWEGGALNVTGSASTFISLGPIQLDNQYRRLAADINIGAASLPGTGLQVQIMAKITQDAPWLKIWSWAALQALFTGGAPSATPPLYVYAPGQTGLVLPASSDTVFDLDVTTFWAVDFQVNPGATYSATTTLFAAGKT